MDNRSSKAKQYTSDQKNDRRFTVKKHLPHIRGLRAMHIQRSIKKALQKLKYPNKHNQNGQTKPTKSNRNMLE